MVDAQGVALAAIQGLYRDGQTKDTRIRELEAMEAGATLTDAGPWAWLGLGLAGLSLLNIGVILSNPTGRAVCLAAETG